MLVRELEFQELGLDNDDLILSNFSHILQLFFEFPQRIESFSMTAAPTVVSAAFKSIIYIN